jgi:hypothetical protein
VTALIAILHLGAALPAATVPFVAPGAAVPAVFAIGWPAAIRPIETSGIVITGVSAVFVAILPPTGPPSETIIAGA